MCDPCRSHREFGHENADAEDIQDAEALRAEG